MNHSSEAGRMVLRAYRGPQDHPAMNDISNAARAAAGDRDLGTLAGFDNHYGHLDQPALARDCAIVELDGRAVAYVRASWQALATGGARVDAIVNVLPMARGIGVEDLILDHAVRRAAEHAADRGGRPDPTLVFARGDHAELVSRLVERGFVLVRRDASLIRPDLESIPARSEERRVGKECRL